MIIFHGDAERVRIHEWLDLKERFPALPNMTASYGGKYGVGKAGTDDEGKENQEGKRQWRRYSAARRARQS